MSLVTSGLKSPSIPVDFKDRPDYERLGVYVTGIPDAEYPWHHDDVKTIRRLYDPGFIPLFRRVVYRSPSGAILSFIHHGFGYYDSKREPDPRLEGCLMPTLCPWPKPNVMGFWFEPSDRLNSTVRNRNGLPAPFRPWGSWIVRMCEEAYEESAKEIREAQKRAQAKADQALSEVMEEARYAEREEASRQMAAVESMTSTDLAEMEARSRGWQPEHEVKPFVHLSSPEVK